MGKILKINIHNDIEPIKTNKKLYSNYIVKSLIFSLVLITLFFVSTSISSSVGAILTSIGNFIFHNLFGMSDFKFFSENNILTIFYRFDNPIIVKYEYTYVTNEFDAHLIFPIILFISITSTEYFRIKDNYQLQFAKNLKILTSKLSIGCLIYLLYYYFRLFILSYQNSLKLVKFDKSGNIFAIIDSQTILFNFFTLLNNIFNIYGGITFRFLIIVFIWLFLFRKEEMKNLLRK